MSMTTVNPTGAEARWTRGRAPVSTLCVVGELTGRHGDGDGRAYAEGQHDQAALSCVSSTLENTDGFVDSTLSFYFGTAPRASYVPGLHHQA